MYYMLYALFYNHDLERDKSHYFAIEPCLAGDLPDVLLVCLIIAGLVDWIQDQKVWGSILGASYV